MTNFHTHTYLCKHAEGTAFEYIMKAAEEGCTELGISDHCPNPASMDDDWNGSRMAVTDVEEYRASVFEGASKAAFPVHLGFECEYDRDFKNWYSDELKGRYGAEYLAFGPHWVTVGKRHVYIPEIDRDKKLLARYTEQTVEGIMSGLYSFVAHPDLFMLGWKEWDGEAEGSLKAILGAACDAGLPVEINGLGILRGFQETSLGPRYRYPYDEFWKMVASSGAKVICNSDAHTPENVMKCALDARKYAASFGITPVETIF